MAAISPSFTVFLGSVACTLMSVLAGESFGLMIGTSIYDMERAITVMTVCALGLMLLGGFYVENVPSFGKCVDTGDVTLYTFTGVELSH